MTGKKNIYICTFKKYKPIRTKRTEQILKAEKQTNNDTQWNRPSKLKRKETQKQANSSRKLSNQKCVGSRGKTA